MKNFLRLLLPTFMLSASAVCNAQEAVFPPTPFYQTSFENWTKTTPEEEIVTIDNYRWKLKNVVVATDTYKRIPTGKKALEMIAGNVNGSPAVIELLDNIPASEISFVISTSGMDGVISSDNRAWLYEVSYDDGATWLTAYETVFTFDRYPSIITVEAPEAAEKPFRFRMRYQGDEHIYGSGYRILIDDISFYPYETGMDAAWDIRPMGMYDGFETSQTSIEVKPLVGGASWIMWGSAEEPYMSSNTFIRVILDEKDTVDIKHLSEDLAGHSAIYNNLKEGKHTLEMMFMDILSMAPQKGVAKYKMDFWVKPYTKISSLSALRNAKEGEFYEIYPNKNDLYLNFSIPICNQHWLIQNTTGIILNDPQYFLPIASGVPERKSIVQRMRGQLIKQDNNLVFQLDDEPELEELNENWSLINFTTRHFSEMSPIMKELEGLCVSLESAHIHEAIENPDKIFVPTPNARFSFVDAKGEKLHAQNIYPHLFLKNKVNPKAELTVFGILGKDFATGEFTMFPILAKEKDTNAIQQTNGSDMVKVVYTDEGISVSVAQKCDVELYTINGIKVESRTMNENTSSTFKLQKNVYILKAKDEQGRVLYTNKVIK